MNIRTLSAEENRQNGFTHAITIDYTDLNTTAGTTKTLDLLTALGIGNLVNEAGFYLETQFASASITALVLELGFASFGVTDDPNGLIEAVSLLAGATPILAGDGTGVAFATKRTGQAVTAAGGKVTALFTSTTANLTALTAGRVHVLVGLKNLPDIVV